MRTKAICRLRRTCRSYHEFLDTYYKQMRNVVRIESLSFSNSRPVSGSLP